MAAIIAIAMPVLPLVASINRSPGRISPRSSARRNMLNTGRSLTEPPGLFPSSLPRMVTPRDSSSAPGRRRSCTSGVLPIVASMVRWTGRVTRPLAGSPAM
jgi:hypothetical protein